MPEREQRKRHFPRTRNALGRAELKLLHPRVARVEVPQKGWRELTQALAGKDSAALYFKEVSRKGEGETVTTVDGSQLTYDQAASTLTIAHEETQEILSRLGLAEYLVVTKTPEGLHTLDAKSGLIFTQKRGRDDDTKGKPVIITIRRRNRRKLRKKNGQF